jgi:hypothetical protein
MDKLVGVDPQIILDRVAQGDMLREIAADYGCVPQTVSMFILRHVEPDVWNEVKEQSIHARLEKSAEAMETAPDQLELARARESARLWMWRAEREHPHRWGSKPSTAVQINGQDGMSVQIVSYSRNNSTENAVESIDDEPDQA